MQGKKKKKEKLKPSETIVIFFLPAADLFCPIARVYSFTVKIQPEKRKARAPRAQIEKENICIKMVLI